MPWSGVRFLQKAIFFARINLKQVICGGSIQNPDPSVVADASTAYVIAAVDASAILNQLSLAKSSGEIMR